MNYLEKYDTLHASLGYHSIELGFGYWSTATGGTIYLFFPEYGTCACDGVLQTIIEEHQLLSWPIRKFNIGGRYKCLSTGVGPSTYSYWPCAYVFHLWKKKDRDKLAEMKLDIESFAWELEHGDDPWDDPWDDEEEEEEE